MLNNNTIANKKLASARAKYVGGEDGVFIIYCCFFSLHKKIYKTFRFRIDFYTTILTILFGTHINRFIAASSATYF